MTSIAYLSLKGQTTGVVKGSVNVRGHMGSILVRAASHGIASPRELQSGQPTGIRRHEPYIITKDTDRSSPVLYSMLATNETITEWELKFFASSSTGHPTAPNHHTHTVKLLNASIASINFWMPRSKETDLMGPTEYEEIAFTYQKIIWTWIDGAITAQDDWAANVT